jgi:steroid delta-isomerase-like uncharacterized protein
MKAIIEQWFDACNNHDTERLLQLYSEFVGNDVTSEHNSFHDANSFQEMWHNIFIAFPDVYFELAEMVKEEDKVAVRWVASGTHKAAYKHVLPTGKNIRVNGACFFTVRNDKLFMANFLWDGVEAYRQLGMLQEAQSVN